MEISLVVPVLNESESIEKLVESIRKQSHQPSEVILVDGGSTDRTVELASMLHKEFPILRVIEAGPATPGRGRNVGVANANCEWIAFTDGGIELSPNWLQELVLGIQDQPDAKIAYGNYEPIIDSFFTQCAALAYTAPKHWVGTRRMRGPSIASCLVHRDLFRGVGGFPDIRASEDLIFMEQVRQSGEEICWVPEATVYWELQPDLRSTFRKFKLYSRENVKAERQADWHYGVARNYVVGLFFTVLSAYFGGWLLILPLLGGMARVARSIWARREGRGLFWLLNPIQFFGVAVILVTIDCAMFAGWIDAIDEMRGRKLASPLPSAEGKQ